MMKSTYLFVVCGLLTLLPSCSNDGDPSTTDNTKDRQEVLINWVDNIIKPSYANFKAKLDVMLVSGAAFTTAPDNTTLTEFRAAWVDAYNEWQKVELFEFGPADQYSLRNFFNIYPTNTTLINNYINDPSASLEVPTAYPAQGFPALDYLINGLAADDAGIIAAYTSDGEASKRVAYLKRLLEKMNGLTTNVVNDWNGTYRDTFISKTGLDIGSSMGKVVNAYVLEYERYVRSGKVGIPAGVFSSGVAQPDKVEAFYKKDISKTLAETAHQAARDFFNGKGLTSGTEGPSFKSYLDALGAKDATTNTALSTVINEQFALVSTDLAGLGENFSSEVETNNLEMTEAYTDMQKLVRLLKLDMSSAISVTITYTDNDGD
jgi:predicted lipoprotein